MMNRRVFIIGVSFLQCVRAVGLLVPESAAMGVSSLYALGTLLGSRYVLAGVLLLSTGLALWGQLKMSPLSRHYLWWFFLQLFTVVVAAIGSSLCMWFSAYTDGVVRPREFIVDDQIIYVLLAIGYLWTISRL